jgi:hypothetical protein
VHTTALSTRRPNASKASFGHKEVSCRYRFLKVGG